MQIANQTQLVSSTALECSTVQLGAASYDWSLVDFQEVRIGKQDACTSPDCYQSKVDAHVSKAIAAKPKIVQISTAYSKQQEGGPTLPRNKYVLIRQEKPSTKEEAVRPEYKTCKYTTEAIVTEGSEKGEIHRGFPMWTSFTPNTDNTAGSRLPPES